MFEAHPNSSLLTRQLMAVDQCRSRRLLDFTGERYPEVGIGSSRHISEERTRSKGRKGCMCNGRASFSEVRAG